MNTRDFDDTYDDSVHLGDDDYEDYEDEDYEDEDYEDEDYEDDEEYDEDEEDEELDEDDLLDKYGLKADTSGIKYPRVRVRLTGHDGNAFSVLGTVLKAMEDGGISATERAVFLREATAGDYDHLLRVCSEWIVVY